MLGRVGKLLKSCLSFWKNFLVSKNKSEFIRNNKGSLKTQVIFLLSMVVCYFVVYGAMRPAIKGACRIILRTDDESTMTGMEEREIGIEAQKAHVGTTLREVLSIGTLKANLEVVIRSEITGKISDVLFTEGTDVKKGDMLIKFEDNVFKAEREKYDAEHALRKAEFNRMEKLYNQKSGSQKTYDEALGQMKAAKAQLESAVAQLEKTVIKAPFDGTIGISKGSISPGNTVQQGTELVNIVDNSKMRVEFTVPVKYISNIAVGQSVEISSDAFPGKSFQGTVDAVDSEVDSKNHSILVKAVIPNRNGNLKHGMFVNVKLITGEKSGVILVDEDAVDRDGAIEFVWAVDEKGRAYRKRVLTGAKTADGVEILAGIKDEEWIVTSGQLKLTDGSRVKILNKNKEGTDDK